ncbi:hypothetical protein SK128_017137 [Halocaridina rubra]|uniref:Larval cuticle protein LCP-17 n=1 Tax=Halocaridina rubra TaxID=373956 RepID=A0AAN8X1Y5_HALRR
MKFIIFSFLAVVAFADKRNSYAPPPPAPAYGASSASTRSEIELAPPVATLRDDRTQDEEGNFNVEFEADNSIVFAQSGSPDGDEGSVVKAGHYSYTAPDGTFVEVKYVADENGYQPQSDLLPVAPEFPHPIPQFVLDQIAKAAEEDEAAAREAQASVRSAQYAPPPTAYGQPQ